LNVSLFSDGKAPMDSFKHESQSVSPSLTSAVIVVVMDICGTALSVFFLAFNIRFRNSRCVDCSKAYYKPFSVNG